MRKQIFYFAVMLFSSVAEAAVDFGGLYQRESRATELLGVKHEPGLKISISNLFNGHATAEEEYPLLEGEKLKVETTEKCEHFRSGTQHPQAVELVDDRRCKQELGTTHDRITKWLKFDAAKRLHVIEVLDSQGTSQDAVFILKTP